MTDYYDFLEILDAKDYINESARDKAKKKAEQDQRMKAQNEARGR